MDDYFIPDQIESVLVSKMQNQKKRDLKQLDEKDQANNISAQSLYQNNNEYVQPQEENINEKIQNSIIIFKYDSQNELKKAIVEQQDKNDGTVNEQKSILINNRLYQGGEDQTHSQLHNTTNNSNQEQFSQGNLQDEKLFVYEQDQTQFFLGDMGQMNFNNS